LNEEVRTQRPKISPGEFFADCAMLFRSRNGTYRDAWRLMTLEELAAGIRLKAGRINALLRANGDRDKIRDDIRDLVNYCYFLAARLAEEEEGEGSRVP
jgi:coenzyme F420-reducing hydrogenase delta subunit